MLIGLTGQIGSGKSSVANIFAELGAVIVDADQIGRQVINTNLSVRKQLVRAFGPGVITAGGKVNRSVVAGAAFAGESARQKLNEIVHPRLLKELHRQVRVHLKTGKSVVIDAALLLEWELDRTVDHVVVVRAPVNVRLARMTSRGFEPADIRRRMKLQRSWAEYRKASDIIIANDGSRTELRRRVIAAWRRLHTQS
jgi:dephospho-CoA kinase